MELRNQAIEAIALYFRALSDPIRLRILNAIRCNPCTIGELTKLLNENQGNISKHVKILADAGVVFRQACGTKTLISIIDDHIFELCAQVCDVLAKRLQSDAQKAAALQIAIQDTARNL